MKVGHIDEKLERLVLIMMFFTYICVLSLCVCYYIWYSLFAREHPYLFFDSNLLYEVFLTASNFLMLLCSMVPIMLMTTFGLTKLLQGYFINNDEELSLVRQQKIVKP